MLADFDDETRAAANQSPTLLAQLEQLESDDWEIQRGASGSGSMANRRDKAITIDSDVQGAQATGVIAHEAGHALHTLEPYVDPTGLTRPEYIERNVARHMKDEGAAQLNAAQVRQEVLSAGGADTGIPGANTAQYQRSHDDFRNGTITREQAVNQMASTMGKEQTSTTGQTYADYYGDTYGNHYDELYGTGAVS